MFDEQIIAMAAPAVLKSIWKGDPPEDVQKEFGELVKIVVNLTGRIKKHNKEQSKASEQCTQNQYEVLFVTMQKITSLCSQNGFIECEDLKKQILEIVNWGREKFNAVEDQYRGKYRDSSDE